MDSALGVGRIVTGSTAGASWAALLAMALLLSMPTAAAQSAPAAASAYDLEEIIVTASRRAESAFAMPYAVILQGMEELQAKRQVRTIPDAMREMSGVMVQKTGHGQGSPFVRGFTGMRTLFLIDGIRLNNSTFRDGPNQYWNTVDPFSIDRLELVKGPSSVLYGSDAIGGTVNAISRRYSDTAERRVVLRSALAERSVLVRPEFAYARGNTEVFAGMSLKDFGDLRAGGADGDQPRTGYDEQGADFKLVYKLGDNRELIGAMQFINQDDAWRTHKTIYGQSWRGTTTGNELRRSLDQRRTLAYLQFTDKELASWASNLMLSASYHHQQEDRLRIRSDGRKDVQGTTVGTLGLWGQFDIPSGLGQWTAGAELYRDDVDSYRRDFNADGSLRSIGIQGPVADDASYVTAAAFLQNQLSIGDNGDLVAGLRFTWSEARAGAVQDPQSGERTSIADDWSEVTGSLRYSHRIDAVGKVRVFAGASQGFRAPNLSDLTRFDSARSNEIEIPVTGLRAENFLNYEVGAKFVGEKWNGQFAAYYTSIDDLIIRTPTGRIIDGDNEISKKNSASGFVQGLELQLRYRFNDSWQMFGNATITEGEVDTFPNADTAIAREPLDRLMPPSIYLGARWQPPASNHWLEALLSVADEQDKLSTRDRADTDRIPPGGTPGYSVLTLRGGWQIADSWKVSLSLENIANKNYRVHGSGVNEPGRNVIVSIFWAD